MNLDVTPLHGVFVAYTKKNRDRRGSFTRLFCDRELAPALRERRIVQINHSRTVHRGSVRGLHYQRSPHAEMKLVRCVRGAAWDVVVDLRAQSPSFLRWHAVTLTAANAAMIIIPEGCAHGFQALSGQCELLYLHTGHYVEEAENGVAWNDPRLAIPWPLPLPLHGALSKRDQSLPQLPAQFAGLRP